MLGVDPRRFGDYATKSYLRAKNEEAYANVFVIHYPDEERAGRPAAAHGALLRPAEGAGRGVRPEVRLGAAQLVRARGHAAGGRLVVPPLEVVRATSATKCRNVAENVGLLDMTAFAKCRVSGPRRRGLPRPPDRQPPAQNDRPRQPRATRSTRAAACTPSSPSCARAADSFYLVSAGAWQRLDHDWLKKHMPTDGSVQFQNLTNAMGVLVVAGPKSAQLLQRVTRCRPLQRRLPLADRPLDRRRPGPGRCAHPRQLRRRAGLGAAPPDRVPEPHLRRADGGRRGPRHQALRHPRHGLHADREVLPPGRHRALDRVRGVGVAASTASSISTRASSSAATPWCAGSERGLPTPSSPSRSTT